MNQYIQLALAASDVMLTVPEFVELTKYPIDTFMINHFWSTDNDTLIYIDVELMTWMGFMGEFIAQKELFMEQLDGFEAGVDYFQYSDNEYERFLSCLSAADRPRYPAADHCATSDHLLLTYKCLKLSMMKLSTSHGDQVRNTIIAFEKVFILYIEYQREFYLVQTTRNITKSTPMYRLIIDSYKLSNKKNRDVLIQSLSSRKEKHH